MTKPNRIDVAHMIEGIGRWVRQESPTRDTTAVNRMIDIVQSEVVDLPVTTERIPGRDGLADMLVVRSAGNGPGILILSHIDTVHPIGMIDEALCFRRDGDRLYGPGLYDMKGGAYLALEAFRQVVRAGSARLPLTFLFTPDEEIGSPMSRSLIEREARQARYALVTEPACEGGKVITQRKGVGRFDVKATGVPSHAGTRHQDGRSAIKEIARQVLAIEAMTDYARGVTTTVGTIAGGTATNVVPQYCQITVGLRAPDPAAAEEFKAKILALQPFDPDVKLVVTGGMNRPPLKKSEASDTLYRHAQAVARDIGFPLDEAGLRGGGSDGNFTAALGVPTLDGLGIDGDGAHTDWEHGLISSIEPRTLLMRGLLETLQ
jgi:glutamate carboxypeptidase